MYVCIAEVKLGETKCKTDNDCGISQAACQNGVCQCSEGDDFVSKDKTLCHRKYKNIQTIITVRCFD